MRYTALRADSHDMKLGGDVVNSLDSDSQHIVQFPVGVTFTRDFEAAAGT